MTNVYAVDHLQPFSVFLIQERERERANPLKVEMNERKGRTQIKTVKQKSHINTLWDCYQTATSTAASRRKQRKRANQKKSKINL